LKDNMAKEKTKIPDSVDDIKKEIANHREAIKDFRFSSAGGKSSHPHVKRQARKEIARLLTALRNKSN